jgi:hypothetical protein
LCVGRALTNYTRGISGHHGPRLNHAMDDGTGGDNGTLADVGPG